MPGASRPDGPLADSAPLVDTAESRSPSAPGGARIPCVGAVIKDDAGRMLLILRGHDPGKGLWSIPGGRIEPGETDEVAVAREVREETGLEVTCGRLLGSVERPGHPGDIIEIRDYTAVVLGGVLAAGDDSADARWFTPDEVLSLDASGQLTRGLLSALRSWGVTLNPDK